MKKIILFAIMMSSLLIACTTEKEPSTLTQHRINKSETRFPIDSYENLYDSIKISVIPNVMGLYDVQELFNDIILGYLDENDIDTILIGPIVEHNQEFILQLFEDALNDTDIPLDLEDDYLAWNDVYHMESIISEMRDSVYITSNFRYEKIYADFLLTEYEKFSLCLIAAINNTIYEELHNNTVVIKDDYNELYYTTQFHPTTSLPVQWANPCDIYEIRVNDVSLFDPKDINIEEYIIHEYGNYIPFCTHKDRVYYLDMLDYNYDKYYVTSKECEEKYQENIDDLEMTVAAAMVGTIVGSMGNLAAVGAMSVTMLVTWAAMKTYYDIERDKCLATAEDNEDSNQ